MGIQRDAMLHNDGGFEAPKNSPLQCDVKMIMLVVTQLSMNVFVKQHFQVGVAKNV
jgi:hypothetical protein